MPPPLVNGKAIAFAGMCVKSLLISSRSMCPLAVGHALQSRHPREGCIHTPHCQTLPKPHQRRAKWSAKSLSWAGKNYKGKQSGQGS